VRPVHAGEGGRGESPLRGCYARESAGDETCPMRGRASARRGESAGDETCPCGGGRAAGRGESAGDETCPMRGREGVGRGESAGGETCPRGGGESAGEETCPMRGRAGAGRGESAGDETCPMRGRAGAGRGVGKRTLSRTHGRKRIGRRDGEGSLLAMRPVHAGEGECAERGWQTDSVTDSRTETDWRRDGEGFCWR